MRRALEDPEIALLVTALEASVDGMALVGTDGRFVHLNEKLARTHGTPADALIGEPWTRLFDEDEQRRLQKDALVVLEETGTWTGEATVTGPDGHETAVELSLAKAPDGRVVLAVSELDASATELDSLATAIPDLVVLLDADGRVLEIPEPGHPLLSEAPEALVGRGVDTLLPDGVDPALGAALDRCLEEHATVQAEHALTVGGDQRHLEVRFFPTEGGQVLLLVRDVTDLREASSDNEEAGERLTGFLDHLDEGIIVEDADRDILHVNQGLVTTLELGTTRQDLLGQAFPQLARDVADLFEDPDRFLDLVTGLPAEETPRRNVELELVDGRVVSLSYLPLDLDHVDSAHLWRLVDVTARVRARAERRAAQEQFEVAVGDLARSLGAADDTEEIAWELASGIQAVTNAKAALVLTPDRLLATACADGTVADEVHQLVRSNPECFDWFDASLGTSNTPIDLVVLPTDGDDLEEADRRKAEMLATQAAIAFHRADVTRRIRKAHDRLQRTARQKQMFLDILSHDLKNPLSVATGRIDLLSTQDPDLADGLEPVQSALERADRLIDRTLLYSRLEEQQGLDREPRQLAGIVNEATQRLADTARAEGIELDVDADPDATARVHPVLVQAVENLLGNAIKWSPEDAQVEIVVETVDRGHRIKVVDHGPGIPPEDRDRLFERFSRVDRTGATGTGLGLAIAKRIVEMHEGRIWHEPTPEGGATFVVELPHSDA